ncbi:MAG: 30S ribosomal protein S11 [Firmicutes bacterium]|nr:30S ribosomal protein S11 [Bacillota bacterium]
MSFNDDSSKSVKRSKKRDRVRVERGIVYIKSTFNNTIVTISDLKGDVLAWCSSGVLGFKGYKKSTPFAAQSTAESVARNVMRDYDLKIVEVYVSGPGSGREAAIRAFQAVGFDIVLIKDVTPIPHNGCRPPKRRRV